MLRYRMKLSGPLLDRIDLQIFVPRVERALLGEARHRGEASTRVAARVAAARRRQLERQGVPNARLASRDLERHCPLEPAARALLDAALTRLALSARAYHRVLKVARTIADLEGRATLGEEHVAEAVGYRELDRRVQ